jgi:hypothetical protein
VIDLVKRSETSQQVLDVAGPSLAGGRVHYRSTSFFGLYNRVGCGLPFLSAVSKLAASYRALFDFG